MVAFAGFRGTGNWGTDERPTHFREMILWSNPAGPSPLFALMAKVRKETINDPQHSWWEETLDNLRLKINDSAGYSAASTTLTLDSGGLDLVAGDRLMMEPATEVAAYASEIVEVSSVTNDTTIVVKRGVSGTTAVGIADNDNITLIGTAFAEGADAPDISSRNPTKNTNFTQIFRKSVGVTNTTAKTKARTGDAWMNDKKRRAFDHARDIEWAMLFGQSNEDTSGSQPLRTMGGLREFITTNRKVYTTAPTETEFLDTISPVFDFTGGGATNERIMMAGNGFLNNLNKIALNSSSTRMNFSGIIDLWGLRLQRWELPQGTLGIYPHPLMSTHGLFKNSAFIINPRGLVWMPLRDTRFRDNIQDRKTDSRKGEWITEATMEIQHEKTMAFLSNFVV